MTHEKVNQMRYYTKHYADGKVIYCARKENIPDLRGWEFKTLEDVALSVRKFNGVSKFELVNGPNSEKPITGKDNCGEFELRQFSEEDAARFLAIFEEGIKQD